MTRRTALKICRRAARDRYGWPYRADTLARAVAVASAATMADDRTDGEAWARRFAAVATAGVALHNRRTRP